MKRTPFKRKSFEEIKASQVENFKRRKELKQKMGKVSSKKKIVKIPFYKIKSKLRKKLVYTCHDFIKKRDSIDGETRKGFCCCCKKLSEGFQFQAGHYRASASCGLLLRYHPQNIHGQCGGCNMWVRQDTVKPEYAEFMRNKYSKEELDRMTELKNTRSLKVKEDEYFLKTMIELYQAGDQKEVIKFIEGYL